MAPDSFKGTLPAAGVADALAAGWRAARPGDVVVRLPLADGGEGTLDALAAAVVGAVRHPVPAVTGPDGRLVDAAWLELPGGRAVAELACASGLPLMRRPDPRGAHTVGLGEVIAAALRTGLVRALSVAVGGSASTDGGAGALVGLGARLRSAAGAALPPGGAALAGLAEIDLSGLLPPPAGGVEVLADVTTPLLGPAGAAAVFGPQKGASAADVAVLDAALGRFAGLLGGRPEAPGAGAAGGTAYGLATAWGASIAPGAARIAELVGLEHEVRRADVVVTGEGRLDPTSLAGKLTGYVAGVAATAGRPAHAVAGQVAADVAWPGARVLSLTDLAGSVAAAVAEPARWLRRAGEELARAR